MDIIQFRESMKSAAPPAGLTAALEGLWWDGKGDWTRAHESAQRDEGPDGSWVHAYLHRKEGDLSNARYWYRRAERAVGMITPPPLFIRNQDSERKVSAGTVPSLATVICDEPRKLAPRASAPVVDLPYLVFAASVFSTSTC
jgi:hypothetical protein